MRIIGGVARGRRLFLPGGCPVRPTSDAVKEALFNLLGDIEGLSFLDLFAGTGSVGIEALSRGAAEVFFVEKNRAVVQCIEDNLGKCGFDWRCEILATDVKNAVSILAKRKARFDILFADPPYDEGFVGETLQCLVGTNLISRDGVVVVQHSVREEAQGSENWGFALTDQRRYGDTLLSFLKINS